MADIWVRFGTTGGINKNGIRALHLLHDHGPGRIGGKTAVEDGELVIHRQTALALLRFEFVDPADDKRIEINRAGMIKIGKAHASPVERRAARAREALEAQADGRWRPAPAGYSAQAERDAAARRREWAQAHDAVNAARNGLNFERRMLAIMESWDEPEEVLAEQRRLIERMEADAAATQAALDQLKQSQERRAA